MRKEGFTARITNTIALMKNNKKTEQFGKGT